jgi:RNA polymerase sigma-70 factor (ECF subfamily)
VNGQVADTVLIDWVAECVLPHEGDVRAWLGRAFAGAADPEDVVQEAYCRLLALDAVDAIRDPRAYFFTVARSVVIDQLRRAQVVRFEALTDAEGLHIPDPAPMADQAVSGRQELALMQSALAALPGRCRQIFELRRIRGLSQKEVAGLLHVTENVVERQTARGLALILQHLSRARTRKPLAKALSDDRRRAQ